MRKYAKHIAFILIACFSFFITGCSEEKVNPGVDKSVSDSEMSAEGWKSNAAFYGEGGRLSTILYYDHMKQYAEKRLTFLSKIKIDFYDSTQHVSSYLTADSGKVEENGAVMYAIGNVIAVNNAGRTLKTELLMWKSQTGKISTDKFVTIHSENEDVQGYGFESDQNIKDWVIFKPVINIKMDEGNQKK